MISTVSPVDSWMDENILVDVPSRISAKYAFFRFWSVRETRTDTYGSKQLIGSGDSVALLVLSAEKNIPNHHFLETCNFAQT